MSSRFVALLVGASLLACHPRAATAAPAVATKEAPQRGARARALGIAFYGAPGPLNAITDVAGLEVGHATIVTGEGAHAVRTGVTAVLPRGKRSIVPVFAGWSPLNGNGEMTGTTWVEEGGILGGPVMLTNTNSVGVVRDAVIAWAVQRFPGTDAAWDLGLPVVAETYDGFLSDIDGFHVTREHAFAALDGAAAGPVAEGGVGGKTDEGASMAQSHTGHLTGSDAVTSAVFRQFGVIRVDGLDELQDTATLLSRAAPPTTDGVCIYAISGGTGAHLADLASADGLKIPDLTRATQDALREWIPGYLRVSNPVDNGGAPSADWRGRKILDTLLADPRVGVLICPITGALPTMSRPLAEDLVAVAQTTDKPIVVIWGSPLTDDPAYTDVLVPSGLPVFRTFGN